MLINDYRKLKVGEKFTHIMYVSKDGNDANGDGSIGRPFLTIQAALTYMGSATSTAEYENDALTRWTVIATPGVYTESITIPNRNCITIYFDNSKMVGTLNYTSTTELGGSSHPPTLMLVGNSLRGAHSSSSVPRMGIEGSINYTPVTRGVGDTRVIQLMLINIGVSGNIDCGNTTTLHQLFTSNSHVIGSVNIAASGAIELFLHNASTSNSSSIGGINGAARFNGVNNVIFHGPVILTGSMGEGKLYNTEFKSGEAHDWSGYTATVNMDANTYTSYFNNVSTKGSETIVLKDDSIGVKYTPNVSADWDVVPDDVAEALDALASKYLAMKLVDCYNYAFADHYKEFTYTAGDLTSIDIWEDSGKATKLFTKTLTYTAGDLTEVELVDEQSSMKLTKTLTYSGGDLDTITVAYASV